MKLTELIAGIFKPFSDLVDSVHTSTEEKMQLQNEAAKLQSSLTTKAMEIEKQLIDAQAQIITAEAQGESWLQRNWRPMLMLSVVAIIVNNYILFPYLSMLTDKAVMLELPGELFTLLTVGVGGYVVGRSGEKVAKTLRGESE